MQEDNGKEDDEASSSSVSKVQSWLDMNSDEILFTSAASSISPASCIILSDDDDDCDDDDDDNAMQKAHSNSSDDMEATVNGIDIIQDRTEALFNQQSFDAESDAACVRYVCDEVCGILNLSKDEVYTPSFGLIQHLMRWVVISMNDRWRSLQWQVDILEKVREAMHRRGG